MGTPASSTTKTGRHDIAEILLKMGLNTKNQIKSIFVILKATYIVGLVFGLSSCVWFYLLKQETSNETYGAAVLLGIGGSTMLVTSLAMTADLIGENTVSFC